MNTLEVMRDYNNGYTLEMLSQKYNCSLHFMLNVIYEFITKELRWTTTYKK